MKTLEEAKDVLSEEMRAALLDVRRAIEAAIGPGFRLILFGSYARGEARPDSDIDLMVVLPDETFTDENKRKVQDAVFAEWFRTDRFYCPLITSEGECRHYSGFFVYGHVEREGVVI